MQTSEQADPRPVNRLIPDHCTESTHQSTSFALFPLNRRSCWGQQNHNNGLHFNGSTSNSDVWNGNNTVNQVGAERIKRVRKET